MPAEESEVGLYAEKRVGYATSRYCALELALDVPAHIPASVVCISVAYRPYEAGCVRLEKKSEYLTPFVVDMTIVESTMLGSWSFAAPTQVRACCAEFEVVIKVVSSCHKT
jgi:hypothetical protein